MKKLLKTFIRWALTPFVIPDYIRFRSRDTNPRFSGGAFYPQVKDKTVYTNFDRHYIYHTAWAARVVREIDPEVHVDISSSLYFTGILSAFMSVDFYDYRPAELKLDNVTSKHADLTNLHFETNSLTSLSCMHTVEHIGLGRYGDPIDPDGDLRAMQELQRVLAPGGSLLFVVPIGATPLIEFNAHRIYTYEQIRQYFKELELREFALIPESAERGGLIRNADPSLAQGERYAAGCFWFVKKM